MRVRQDYAKKIAEIDYIYDMGLQRSEYKEVIAKCTARKLNYESDEEWVAVVDSILASIRHDPLKHEIKKQAYAISQICPVCGNPAEPITLMRDKKAYYCRAHKAVTPAIANDTVI
jgi:hypothetical protein